MVSILSNQNTLSTGRLKKSFLENVLYLFMFKLVSLFKQRKRLNTVIRGARVFSNLAAADSYQHWGNAQNLKSTL